MGRYSRKSGDVMEYGLHLVFNAKGDVRMSRGPAALAIGERAVALTVSLPLAMFRTPSLSARLTVDAPDPSAIPQIDVQAAESALRSVVGCDVSITVRPEGE
jgi:hypothetical protein